MSHVKHTTWALLDQAQAHISNLDQNGGE